jgi:hypothetical protein
LIEADLLQARLLLGEAAVAHAVGSTVSLAERLQAEIHHMKPTYESERQGNPWCAAQGGFRQAPPIGSIIRQQAQARHTASAQNCVTGAASRSTATLFEEHTR